MDLNFKNLLFLPNSNNSNNNKKEEKKIDNNKQQNKKKQFLYIIKNQIIKKIYLKYIILDKKPENIIDHNGELKSDIFCLKVDHSSELYSFLSLQFQVFGSMIYILKNGKRYCFFGSIYNIGEDIDLKNTLQPENMKNYRFWSVNYISMFYQWINSDKMIDSSF